MLLVISMKIKTTFVELQKLTGHIAQARSVNFSTDGLKLASCNDN